MISKELALSRLEKFKKIDGNCWKFSGSTVKGYGQINIEGKPIRVNRLSAYIFHDLDLTDENKLALHKVECPNKDCWNPDHIYVGNTHNNMSDRVKVGTYVNQYTYATRCKRGHEYIFNGKRRICKECKIVTQAKRRAQT